MMTAAQSDLVEQNLGLVHACCHKMTGRGIEYDDLYGAGCLGLVKAARGFDPTRGLRFSTYAVPVILGEIRRLFRDGGSLRVSRSLRETAAAAARQSAVLSRTLGREPTVTELAESLQLPAERVTEALLSARPVLSLTAGEEEGQLEVPVAGCEESLCDRQSLRQTIAALPPADRQLLALRYYGGKTQTQTAAALGLSQVQVSRRERALLRQLREELV